MKGMLRVAAPAMALLLGACGGGDGGGGSSTPPPVVVTPAPTVSVALSETAATLSVPETGGEVSFDAVVTGATATMVADVQFDAGQIELRQPVTAGADGVYRVRFRTRPGLDMGVYDGAVTFRMCAAAGCDSVYATSVKRFAYNLTVRLGDWTTFQRNAAHTGFVPATFDPAKFTRAWEFTPANSGSISVAAAARGIVYVTSQQRDGTAALHAVSGQTGEALWLYNLGRLAYWSGPAVGDGRVFVTTMSTSSHENAVISVDARTGEFRPPNGLFASQWSSFLQPTPYGNSLYVAAGFYGNFVYGYDYTALQAWSADTAGRMWGGQTPAVDADTVYYYSGLGIEQINRADGALGKRLEDPFFQSNGYDYYGAPILGTLGNVMAYSGHRDQPSSSVLVNWATGAAGGYRWRSADSYVTTPAVGNGSVYLARNDPARLDALNETTGAVQWSWTAPAGERFRSNTVATRTLVFVSTDKAVYAIPATGSNRTPVWSAPISGDLAITSDGMLIVTCFDQIQYGSSVRQSMVAYRLR